MSLFPKKSFGDYNLNGYYSLGGLGKEVTYDEKLNWLEQLEKIENDWESKKGAQSSADAIFIRARVLLDEILDNSGDWPYYDAWTPYRDIPERVLFLQRLNKLKFETAPKVSENTKRVETNIKPSTGKTIERAKENPALVESIVEAGKKAKEDSQKSPLVRAVEKEAAILKDAAKMTAEDLKNPMHSIFGNYKYLVYAGLGIAGLTVAASILSPYVAAFNSVRGAKRRRRRRRRR